MNSSRRTGDQFHHPHERGIDENGDDPLLHLGEAVQSEALRGQEPQHEEDDGDEQQAEGFPLELEGIEPLGVTQPVHLLDEVEPCEILEHIVKSSLI